MNLDHGGLPDESGSGLLRALRQALRGWRTEARLAGQHRLKANVFRLHFEAAGQLRSLVVKRLDPARARRNELAIRRWLPAEGMGGSAPALLGTAPDRSGEAFWHVYEDLGECPLATDDLVPEHVVAVVRLIASLHVRFASHPLLAECRLHGGDLGVSFFESNVRDASRALQALGPPRLTLSSGQAALRDRLLERLDRLLGELPARARAIAEWGGPETLLHGDLWNSNTFVEPTKNGPRARLIDWDHAGVGPASYDLSTFLLRFPPQHRRWIVDVYGASLGDGLWPMPGVRELNLVFETAEYGRCANRLIWPALALIRERAAWGFEVLEEVERWFVAMAPTLPDGTAASPKLAPCRR